MMLGVLGLACLYRSWNQSRVRVSKEDEEFSIEKDIKKIAGRARLGQREYFSLESVMDEFQLSNETLRRLMSHMDEYMDRGLEGGLERSTIAMLPSFLPELPDGTECGKFVALDLGGTNLRVMTMYVEPGKEMQTEQFNTSVPKAAMQGTGEQLFDYITKVLADFLVEKGLADENLPLGFTFSYPCDQTSIRVATLSRWTKGFTASGVIGEDVVRLLEEAIKRDGRTKVEVVAVLNDTVGTIVAGAYEMKGKCDLGVIIGTGTNASYMENTEAITHGLKNATEPYYHKQMIIDTEWGGFGDRGEAEYIRTQYDKIVDKRSDHPGNYCFDKLVAGKCMGEVVRLVLEKLCTLKVLLNGERSNLLYTVGSFPTKYISEILRDDWGTYSNTKQIMDELGIEDYSFSDILLFREVCLVVSRRSANLIAAAIACVLNRIRRPKMTVAIDGSTYKYHPFFEHWVVEKVKELLDPGLKFKVVQTSDGSGKGAALIAAIVTRMKRKEEETRRKQGSPQVNESIETEKKLYDGKRRHLETYEDDYRPKGPPKPSPMVVELSYTVDDVESSVAF